MKVLSTFEKAKRYIENKTIDITSQKKYNIGPCITISREAGAGSGLIADKLVEYLSFRQKDKSLEWGIFDKNLIEKVLEDNNLPLQLKKYLEEDKAPVLKTIMNELFGIHPSLISLEHKVSETILELASIGNVIIIGRGGNLITKSLPNSFHVRLVAPVDIRIKNVRDFYGNSKQEAIDFIKSEDVKRQRFIMEHFRKRADDPLLYNMVINTSQFELDSVARLIAESVIIKYPDFYDR